MSKYIFLIELNKPYPNIRLSKTYTITAGDAVYSGITLRQRKYRGIYRLYGYASPDYRLTEKMSEKAPEMFQNAHSYAQVWANRTESDGF